ncbi:imidazolonepropionase [Caldanaerobacter subterraneus subsp. tengcongensis MB4]|uniref:Imidazolonepropionase n=1 Tax=Caldanaerobacter subterraneus subsp. tengcongensis (strain DSM 15242 / JCM 11007 / NBRC 100824 / MB4) TaxID=273068 RepID=HUTI_CALS4|nr:imidazolonepropionase [Caldanaerobacter subterraneus]Q8RCH7.1 RecName: Full=Imidazolonepropionase; AltName: Full=Imidazolone-5-propionate hydrolase [Caldanaerobacter subterraneus subsp. tengcongensis MB4]AAM23735.1 Imidazolonepropionase and related amidohydrolases [Caldanaerobacter subterraneus subsp. tengcongensis MB4]MCS3916770.1 imidazolonepropionase [Caldanaerobacter subterraneus subsp. tengcongensis MB4]
MRADLLIYNISKIYTPIGTKPLCGEDMEKIEEIENAYIAIKDGKILAAGKSPAAISAEREIDAKGMIALPGFVDPHTHVMHYGSRENEMALKLKGYSYIDILKQGGGIHSTVRATREASDEALLQKALKSLEIMLSHGVTTVEVKSGYGLNTEQEIRLLRLMNQLKSLSVVDIVPTFLGAHAIPQEFEENPWRYVEKVINEMLPKVKEEDLAEFCDVFCEEGAFDYEQSKKILEEAKKLGFRLKIHADELTHSKGGELAGILGAISADHLEEVSDEGIDLMKKAGTVAVLLPGVSFFLNRPYADARRLIERGLPVALGTDYNPGTSPTENLQLIMSFAYINMKMRAEEILTAVTLNAACAIDRGDEIGTIEEGKRADIVLVDAPNLDYMMYHFGINHVNTVIKAKGNDVVVIGIK